jgi:hypothetical protein
MERDDARPRPARPARTTPAPRTRPPATITGRRPALLTIVGLSLAACISRRALVLCIPWRRASRLWPVGSRSLLQRHRRRRKICRPPNNPLHLPFKWPRWSQRQRKQHHRQQQPWLRPHRKTPAPAAPAALPDQTQLLQTIARDLANLERTIEQLKANQQQMAGDNSKAIAELKASQEEMKRALARVSEQSPPKTSPPQARPASTQPAPALRKPERKLERSQARARPRYRREWIYDDDW